GVHGLDDRDLVDDLRGVRQQLAHPRSRLSVLFELEERSDAGERALARSHSGDALAAADRIGQLRPVQLFEGGLVIEGLDLRRAARLVQEDHPLHLRRVMRQSDQTAGLRVAARLVLDEGEPVQFEQRSQRGDADALRAETEELSPRQMQIEFTFQVHLSPPQIYLKPVHNRRSLWSAVARYRFGSLPRYRGD